MSTRKGAKKQYQILREMQIKTAARHHFVPTEHGTAKRTELMRVGKDRETRDSQSLLERMKTGAATLGRKKVQRFLKMFNRDTT